MVAAPQVEAVARNILHSVNLEKNTMNFIKPAGTPAQLVSDNDALFLSDSSNTSSDSGDDLEVGLAQKRSGNRYGKARASKAKAHSGQKKKSCGCCCCCKWLFIIIVAQCALSFIILAGELVFLHGQKADWKDGYLEAAWKDFTLLPAGLNGHGEPPVDRAKGIVPEAEWREFHVDCALTRIRREEIFSMMGQAGREVRAEAKRRFDEGSRRGAGIGPGSPRAVCDAATQYEPDVDPDNLEVGGASAAEEKEDDEFDT